MSKNVKKKLLTSLIFVNLLLASGGFSAAGVTGLALDEPSPYENSDAITSIVDVLFLTDRLRDELAGTHPPVNAPWDFFDRYFTYEIGARQVAAYAEVHYPTGRNESDGDRSFYSAMSNENNPVKNFMVNRLKYIIPFEHLEPELSRRHDVYGETPLIFVHGFNNSFTDAVINAARIQLDTGNRELIAFLWPGDLPKPLGVWPVSPSYLFGYSPFFLRSMYRHAQYEEKISAGFLTSLIYVVQEAASKSPNILAHSMGAQLFFDSIIEAKGSPQLVNNAILAAPDISFDVFKGRGQFWAQSVGRTFVYCGDDKALFVSGGINEGGERLGYCPRQPKPLDNVRIKHAIGITGYIGHGYFVDTKDILGDIKNITGR